MPAIEVTKLSKSYGSLFNRRKVQALKELTLEIQPGSAFGLIGLNGAGKTTFIKSLLGVVRPDGGTIRILNGSPDDPNIRCRIGYLPERLNLPKYWTPLNFLLSVARMKRLNGSRELAGRQLKRFGLIDTAARKIGGFSKGMKQRLGLAAALIGDPELLILDEPTDGVDPLGRVKVREILIAAKKRGVTIFINSHLLTETERICDRVGIISAGSLIREGDLRELCEATNSWRARFAPGYDENELKEAGFSPTQEYDAWSIEAIDPSALNQALDRVRGAGAELLSLNNEIRGLEDVLADAVKMGKS